MNRSQAARIGQETVRILDAGRYTARSGRTVEIADAVRRAVAGTRSYPPDAEVPSPTTGERPARLEVTNETTLAAAGRLAAEGLRPVALNFASAKNPGGGFLGGARAQEESLARASGLYACLVGNSMYEFHRAAHDPMYSHYILYSPDVPVFRDDDGELLEEPFLCSFVTSPAVNARVVLERDPSRRLAVSEAMEERIRRVLAVMAHHGHDTAILGAWGCGVFGNDPEEIADLFGQALRGPFAGAFSRVVFAVLDWSAEQRTIGPFQRLK